MASEEEMVQFEDGKYGIRRGRRGYYQYKDLKHSGHWWPADSSYFMTDCRASKKVALQYWINSKDIGTPVDPHTEEPKPPTPPKKGILPKLLGWML